MALPMTLKRVHSHACGRVHVAMHLRMASDLQLTSKQEDLRAMTKMRYVQPVTLVSVRVELSQQIP